MTTTLALQAQTATFHLHRENSSTTGLFQLKASGPDAGSLALQTANLQGQAANEYVIKEFGASPAVPYATGVIPSGSTLSLQLWMKKTANLGTMFPRAKLKLNTVMGNLVCTATGTTPLTTTLSKYTISCTTTADISLTRWDRFYLWVGVNLAVASNTGAFAGELDVESPPNISFDSQMTAPVPGPAALSDASLLFANQTLNTTSAAQAVTLSNNQVISLAVSGITVTGDYAQTNNCGASLAARASCTINVTFKPAASGSRAGTLTITDQASNSPQKAALSGTGISGIALNRISVAPSSPRIVKGATQQFKATGEYSNSSKQDITTLVTWTSSSPSGAAIASSGLATGTVPGAHTITAKSASISGASTLTVTNSDLVSIAVTPANTSIAKGNQQQFTATGTYADGSTQDITASAAWASLATGVATIDAATGLATSVDLGTTTISATSGTVTGSTQLTVTAPELVSITVTPANASIALGRTQQFTAIGTYTDQSTQNLTNSAAWASSDTTIAAIDAATGLATSVGVGGPTTITAMSGTITGLAQLTVTAPELVSITVTPANASIALGRTQQFTAIGTYTDQSTQNLTNSAAWASSASNVATIGAATGLATSVGVGGPTTITATSGTITGSTQLTVTAPVLDSIQVSPASASIVSGTTQQFTATGRYSDQSTQNLTNSATWSSDQTVATINNNGLATGVGAGTTYIQATAGTVSGAANLTVTTPLPPVVQVQPADHSTNVPYNTRVVIRFAQPVRQASIVAGTLRVQLGTNDVNGNVLLSADGLSLTFAPSPSLTGTTDYNVRVTDVASGQINPMFQSTFRTSSTTDTVAPQVTLSSPQPQDTGVPTNAPIKVQFSKPIDPATVTSQSFVVSDVTDPANPRPVTGMLQVDATGLTASFVPQPVLLVLHTIRVQLTGGVQDTFGNPLTGYFMQFATSYAADTQGPTLLGVNPPSGATSVPQNAIIVAQFDKPLAVTSISGFQLQLGGVPVSCCAALSDSNRRITFTPQGGLTANQYTIVANSQLTSVSGIPLTNPGNFAFTAVNTQDSTQPVASIVTPPNSAVGVPTNVIVVVTFNKPIDRLTVNQSSFQVYPTSTLIPIPGLVSVSADGQTATFTPSNPLVNSTNYTVNLTPDIIDWEGHSIPARSTASFTTGQGIASTLTVVSVSPANGASGIPINPQVVVQVSAPVNPLSVSNSAITVSTSGTPVGGTVSVSSDGTVLTFVPGSLLTPNTPYNVTVGGFRDQAGNLVTPFPSSFRTWTSTSQNNTNPTVVSVNPANGATGVDVGSTIVLTFNEALNPISVSGSTIPISVNGFTGVLAGNYALDATGMIVTFTPLSPFPGSATITVSVGSVIDLSGHQGTSPSSSFTTVASADPTPPTVLSVTPGNGATGVGLNAFVVLTFSKSLNWNTINSQGLGLAINGNLLPQSGYSINPSPDNRIVTLGPVGPLPPASTIAVVATGAVRDLAGNPLVNFQSQFRTASAFDADGPTVLSQRPANGATGVPLNSTVVVYFSEPMNTATIPGALHIVQNGVVMNGNVQVTNNGQVATFTPGQAWQPGTQVRVIVDTTAQDVDGNSLNVSGTGTYYGTFTPAGSAPPLAAIGTVPGNNFTSVPTNIVISVAYNQPIGTPSISCKKHVDGQIVGGNLTLAGGNTIAQFTPSSQLLAGTNYDCDYAGETQFPGLRFMTGSGSDQVAPTMSVAPSDGATNVPDNASIRLSFSKRMNQFTVNASSVQLSAGSTALPGSITFIGGVAGDSALFVPHTPLPDMAQITININGITDFAGNPVPQRIVHFMTGNGPDLVSPIAVAESPFNAATNVAINTAVQVQSNKPLDPGTVNGATFWLRDNRTNQNVISANYSVSTDGRTMSMVPNPPLALDRNYTVMWNGVTDLAGNKLVCPTPNPPCNPTFTTGPAPDSSPLQVVGVSPDGLTGVATNAQVLIQFSKPVNPATLGQVTFAASSGAVGVSSALSNANQTLILAPLAFLSPNATYTVTVAGVTDLVGNGLASTVTKTFTTGTAADLILPTIVSKNPGVNATGVPTNALVHIGFSKRIDPLTVTTATLQLTQSVSSIPLGGNVSVSADGRTATFTPSSQLAPSSSYTISASNGITDLSGLALSGSFPSSFTTGAGSVTAPTVLAVSPPNGATGAPINAQVVIQVSAPVDTLSVSNSAITVSQGTTPIAGTVSVSSDGTVLTWRPNGLLLRNTSYSVVASGFTDLAGNQVVRFPSSFATGSASTANTMSPAVVSVTPANGSTGVATNSNIIFIFNEPVNALSVNANTVPISTNTSSVAGTYATDATGRTVTFTPTPGLPANATVFARVNGGVLDLSGNAATSFSSSFTTSVVTDTTPPAVVNVTPNNGSTGIGLNASVVLRFSKPLNAGTLNHNTVALFANGSQVTVFINVSADNQSVTLKPQSNLPPSSTVTVVATNGIQDLSGNGLVNFQSQFTTISSFDTDHPVVVTSRPVGPTNVPLNAKVVLYFSEPMLTTTLPGALHIAQNGVAVNGSIQVGSNGQAVQFTPPGGAWQPNALIEVFMDSTALDVDGISLTAYQASFTTAADPNTTAPRVTGTNPANFATMIPTNVIIQAATDLPLDSSTVNSTTVLLTQNGTDVPRTVTLLGGNIINVQPSANLPTGATCLLTITTNVRGANRLALAAPQSSQFTAGSAPDMVAPTVTLVSPPNGTGGVGTNAEIRVLFSKPMNPLSINGNTIQITGGSTTVVPDSIKFSNMNQSVQLVPTLLPDATPMTVTISGMTDVAGNAVVSRTTQFTTGTGPDVTAPVVVAVNPSPNATNVPTSAVIQVQVSEPLDPVAVNSSTFGLWDATSQQFVAGNPSLSTDGTVVTFPPTPLAQMHNYVVLFNESAANPVFHGGLTDLEGNTVKSSFGFRTGNASDSTNPQVGVSPANGLSGVPTNSQILVQFSKPINPATLQQVTLTGPSGTVNVIPSLTNANQTFTLTPVSALQPNASYTVTVTGVQDMSGNGQQPATVTNTFTTGTTGDLVGPTVLSVNPNNGAAGVAINAVAQVKFSKRINPLTVTTATFQVYPTSTQVPINGSFALSADGQTITFTPSSFLSSSTNYTIRLTSGISDLVGQPLSAPSTNPTFTTGTAQATAPLIAWINPASAFAGTSVTISGFGFGTTPGTVTFNNNVQATTITSWGPNEIVVSVPNGAITGNVFVTASSGASNTVLFTVLAAPTVTSVSPPSATVGTPITITGTNFGSALDNTIVKFNGVTATGISVVDSSHITAPVPSTATTGPVTVTVNSLVSNSDRIFSPINPMLTAATPSTAGINATITLTGFNFGQSQGQVRFNTLLATNIVSWTDTQIRVTVPSGAASGNITVTNGTVTSNPTAFNVAQLSVTGIMPIAGLPGTSVTIAGTGFGFSQADATVSFNGTPAVVTSWTGQQIVAVVSQGTTNGPVSVTVGGITAQGPYYSVDFTALLTDSLTNQTTYKAAVIGGQWFVTDVSGSGCSTCSGRGVHHYEYDSAGNMLSDTNELGQTITYIYDANGNTLSESFGGATTSYTYNSFNEVLTQTDPLGNKTSYTYNPNGNLKSITTPSPDGGITQPSITQFEYDPAGTGLLTKITDPLQNATRFDYWPTGQVKTITDANNKQTYFEYDPRGNRRLVRDALQHQTQFLYDFLNRLTLVTFHDSTTIQYHYDPVRGRLDQVTDQNSYVTNYAYDNADRLVAVVDANAATCAASHMDINPTTGLPNWVTLCPVTTYGYDTESNLASITDARGRVTCFQYFPQGWLKETDFQAGAGCTNRTIKETYEYDLIGNLKKKIDRNGQEIDYDYDALNRLRTETWVGANPAYSVSYTYDLASRLAQVTDPTGTYNFTPDNMGRLTEAKVQYSPPLPTRTLTIDYLYDAASNRKTMYDAERGETDYGYDALNRLHTISDFNGNPFTLDYDDVSRRTKLWRLNHVNTNYGYDNLNRILSVLHQLNDTTTLDGASYILEGAGNPRTKTDQRTQAQSTDTYDNIYQLKQVTQGASTTESYNYDLVGNRQSSLGIPSYTVNDANEYTATSLATYTYDSNGNMRTKTDANGQTTYTWDFQNRLTSVQLPGTGGTASFIYDPFGRRIQKKFVQGSAATITNYLYDAVNVIETLDQNGNQLARYSQNLGIDELLAMTRGGATSFLEQDELNSVTSLTNVAGTITDTYTYDTLGNVTASSGSTPNPFRFTGREFDSETGLYYLRARYLDPSTGRFISEDPTGFDGGNDFYTYIGNNPVNYVDPFGLAQCYYSISHHMVVCYPNKPADHPQIGPRLPDFLVLGPEGVHSGDDDLKGKACKDNMKCVNERDHGPIVPGKYKMNLDTRVDTYDHAAAGQYRLEPWPHRPYDGWLYRHKFVRGGFEFHLGSITHGCINAEISNPKAREQYQSIKWLLKFDQGENYLTVTP